MKQKRVKKKSGRIKKSDGTTTSKYAIKHRQQLKGNFRSTSPFSFAYQTVKVDG